MIDKKLGKIKKGLFVMLFVCFSFFGFMVLVYSVNANPIYLNNKTDHKFYFKIFSQSWKFFTNNAQAEKLHIYKIKNGKVQEIIFNNFQGENLYGLKKENRIISEAISEKINKLPEDKVFNYRGQIDRKILKKIKFLTQLKFYKFKFLAKGRYLAQLIKPVPWAWNAKLKKRVFMPSRIIIINVV